jgi:hypothetical protein
LKLAMVVSEFIVVRLFFRGSPSPLPGSDRFSDV